MKTPKHSLCCLSLLGLAVFSPLALAADTDRDGLDDAVETNTGIYVSEFNTGSNPAIADTDGDGVTDGVEVADATNPTLNTDHAAFSALLRARYAFDVDATDSSGLGAHGTLLNGPTFTSGVLGQSISFDGINDYFARNPTPNNTLPFTWTMWIKAPASTFGTWIHAMEIGSLNRKSPGLEFWPADATHYKLGLYQYPYPSVSCESALQTCADSTAWHHLVFASEAGGTRRFYADGILVLSIDLPSYGEVNTTLYLGGSAGLSAFSKYQADEVRVYNRALSAGEVEAMHAVQQLRPPSIGSNLPALVERTTGATTELSITATGNPRIFTYQWYLNDVAIAPENGGQQAALTVTVNNATAGYYRIRISNSEGQTDSSTCLVAPSEDNDSDGLSDWRENNVYNSNPSNPDTDGDGLNDGYEVNVHNCSPTNSDSDSDGFIDGYEVTHGSSPSDNGDLPDEQARVMVAVELRFPAGIGRNYRIESSNDLIQWDSVESGIPGNGSEIQRFYSIEGSNRQLLRIVEESGPE